MEALHQVNQDFSGIVILLPYHKWLQNVEEKVINKDLFRKLEDNGRISSIKINRLIDQSYRLINLIYLI